MTHSSGHTVVGKMSDVYEDLGPSIKVCIKLDDGGIAIYESYELPVSDEATLRSMIGKRIMLKISALMEVED